MKQGLLVTLVAVVLLAMVVSLGLGIYGMATGHYILYAGGAGQHRGWDDGQTRGRGQGWRWNEGASADAGQGQPGDLSGGVHGQGKSQR